jgi:hypothetical protein
VSAVFTPIFTAPRLSPGYNYVNYNARCFGGSGNGSVLTAGADVCLQQWCLAHSTSRYAFTSLAQHAAK